MSEATSKEQRRNLRKEIGEQAAAAVVELRELVQKVRLEHITLARQMLEFEGTVATIRQSRSTDQARLVAQGTRVDDALEQLEALRGRLKFETVNGDAAYHAIGERGDFIRPIGTDVDALCADVARLRWWAERRATLSRWQRFMSFVTGRCAVRFDDYDAQMEVLQHPSLVPRVATAVADAKPLPWRAAHQGAREPR